MPTLPFKLNQAGRRHIPRQKHKVTNWPAYDASLRQRGSLTVWFSDEAITAWEAGFTHQTYLSLKTGPQSALRSLTGLVLRWLSQGIGGAERLRNHPKHRTADPYA